VLRRGGRRGRADRNESSGWCGPRAGARGGARTGRSRCSMIWWTTGGSVRNRSEAEVAEGHETIRISPRPTLRVGARRDSGADRSRRPERGAEPSGSGPWRTRGRDPGCGGSGRPRLQRGRRRRYPPRRPSVPHDLPPGHSMHEGCDHAANLPLVGRRQGEAFGASRRRASALGEVDHGTYRKPTDPVVDRVRDGIPIVVVGGERPALETIVSAVGPVPSPERRSRHVGVDPRPRTASCRLRIADRPLEGVLIWPAHCYRGCARSSHVYPRPRASA